MLSPQPHFATGFPPGTIRAHSDAAARSAAEQPNPAMQPPPPQSALACKQPPVQNIRETTTASSAAIGRKAPCFPALFRALFQHLRALAQGEAKTARREQATRDRARQGLGAHLLGSAAGKAIFNKEQTPNTLINQQKATLSQRHPSGGRGRCPFAAGNTAVHSSAFANAAPVLLPSRALPSCTAAVPALLPSPALSASPEPRPPASGSAGNRLSLQ